MRGSVLILSIDIILTVLVARLTILASENLVDLVRLDCLANSSNFTQRMLCELERVHNEIVLVDQLMSLFADANGSC